MEIFGLKKRVAIPALLLLAGLGVCFLAGRQPTSGEGGGSGGLPARSTISEKVKAGGSRLKVEDSGGSAAGDVGESSDENAESEEIDEEERLVGEFDSLTDKWMEPAKNGVSPGDIDKFVTAFKKLPETRRDECINRALNLVPDENVMLLVGILFDKTVDNEIRETVFNDVLNRDEAVKKPIMNEIFKDRTHPCWKDVAWILDVTGELPAKSE